MYFAQGLFVVVIIYVFGKFLRKCEGLALTVFRYCGFKYIDDSASFFLAGRRVENELTSPFDVIGSERPVVQTYSCMREFEVIGRRMLKPEIPSRQVVGKIAYQAPSKRQTW
ncbi:hypothetical protein D3C73_1495350 [compost metagenome]